ncbi:hypothetical protein B0H21DRAFT_716167 [Amylocystis lapponica]|nr:hypothetical protein B0H21DRAFT_716167 [Amylocystis lapponica]
MDATGNLLSLKVMRVSRPSLASAWEPFYTSSVSFSEHSTASIMSLQSEKPLPGHPTTLRDLTHISEVLTLPSSFGAIQLGETFSSCLSVNNEANVDVEGVTLKVEMQTASTKTTLAEFGGADFSLTIGDSMEKVVSHEIKELGQHVLGCTVSYRLPIGIRTAPGPAGEVHDPSTHAFRKFYKFAVTNPLSVKTKVHLPRSPSALLSRAEREKVFLEVHIQNMTQDAMWLDRMQFECTDGWSVQDANTLNTGAVDKGNIFSGAMALIQPQDMRQYMYILSPTVLAAFPVTHAPGSIIHLGRLDISWRSSFGEPGRLLTSMLSRRIPLIQPVQPQTSAQAPVPPSKQGPSAIPLHLQRTASLAGTPPRPRSPQLSQRPNSPPVSSAGPVPYRSSSPFRSLTALPSIPAQPPASPLSPHPAARRPEDIQVDLVVRSIPHESLCVEQPFEIAFTIAISALIPTPRPTEARKQRILSLVVQHLEPPRIQPTVISDAIAQPIVPRESWSPRMPSSGLSTPSPSGTPYRGDFQDALAQKLLVASPRQLDNDGDTDTDGGETPAPPGARGGFNAVHLPAPYARAESSVSKDVVFLGTSALFLPQLRLAVPPDAVVRTEHEKKHERDWSVSTTDSEADSEVEFDGTHSIKMVVCQEFELSYLPLRRGFAKVGGLRVVLVEDRIADEGSAGDEETRYSTEVRTLKEWDVVGEIWVRA